MVRNPYVNAVAAAAYIVLLVTLLSTFVDGKGEPSLLIPITMLSLFVLSASVMGYLFVFQPVTLYLDGKKSEAVTFFLKTVATFACFAALFLISLFVTMT